MGADESETSAQSFGLVVVAFGLGGAGKELPQADTTLVEQMGRRSFCCKRRKRERNLAAFWEFTAQLWWAV